MGNGNFDAPPSTAKTDKTHRERDGGHGQGDAGDEPGLAGELRDLDGRDARGDRRAAAGGGLLRLRLGRAVRVVGVFLMGGGSDRSVCVCERGPRQRQRLAGLQIAQNRRWCCMRSTPYADQQQCGGCQDGAGDQRSDEAREQQPLLIEPLESRPPHGLQPRPTRRLARRRGAQIDSTAECRARAAKTARHEHTHRRAGRAAGRATALGAARGAATANEALARRAIVVDAKDRVI